MYEPYEQIVVEFSSECMTFYMMIIKEYYDQFHNCINAELLYKEKFPRCLVRVRNGVVWDHNNPEKICGENSSVFITGKSFLPRNYTK